MDWKAAIDKFEERRLAIWENMPHDVYDLSNGVVPGDTNVYGQYVMTALYADSELLQVLHRIQGLDVHIQQLPGHGDTGELEELGLIVQQVHRCPHGRGAAEYVHRGPGFCGEPGAAHQAH